MLTRSPFLALFALLPSCITITAVNIGTKSSLEKQLMGETEPLSEEELLVSSVRAPGGVQPGSEDDLTSKALSARRRQLFNRDDVDELKTAGCLGEALKGRLVGRPCDKLKDPEVAQRRDRLVDEENADRSAIIDWAISVDPVLTRTDRPQLEDLYRRLILERAKPGELTQNADGSWPK